MAGFYGVPAKDRKGDEILDALGLGDKKQAYVRQLSGGMKRRLMVAKALVHAPPILILDEPTAGVDVELRRQLWEYVRKLNAQGTTIVLTTHYLEEAQEMCDQIAIINQGNVAACEPTPKLLRRLNYKTLVVRPSEPLNSVPPGLGDLEPVRRKDGSIAITYRTGETSIEQLLHRLREAGVGIGDLATEEPDLEDVFVALTSG
jgi:ABC-2 type transport system ATP-binding protein